MDGGGPRMHLLIAKEEIAYNGSQLASHFAFRRFRLSGDSLVVFKGPMDIPDDKIVDLEDLLSGSAIRSASMLHFIAEFFGASLETVVLRQRLLARLAADVLGRETGSPPRVEGDDLFVGEGKLSVSIAAPSPVSCLIHFGINILDEGVPVKAACLKAMGADPDRVARLIGEAFIEELESVRRARSKVRAVP